MVAIKTIRAANAALLSNPPPSITTTTYTAVFVGATSGIGLSTLKTLAAHVKTLKVYIVGRSQASATPLLKELHTINPSGEFIFIEAQVALLKSVDEACKEIRAKESKIDLLFLSAGGLAVARRETPEGLDTTVSLAYYSRMRFTSNLLPLLSASSSPRVISVLAGGKEGVMKTDDLELRYNYSLPNYGSNFASMTSLSFIELAKANPSVSFIHIFPGLVATDLLSKLFGMVGGAWAVLSTVARWVLVPVLGLFSTSVEEAGEIELWVATTERFSIPGAYRLDWNGDDAKPVKALDDYEKEGMGKTVWEHTVGVFDRITAQD